MSHSEQFIHADDTMFESIVLTKGQPWCSPCRTISPMLEEITQEYASRDKVNGCEDRVMPACVEACRAKNAGVVPQPAHPIPKPFPRGQIEDWSKKQEVTDRLTPYNYLFIQKAVVEHKGEKKTVSIPRRCMHCDNPACATICPFSANHKFPTGAVVIDQDICFGGAKCKEVCPWAILTGWIRRDYAEHRHPLWIGEMAVQMPLAQEQTPLTDAPPEPDVEEADESPSGESEQVAGEDETARNTDRDSGR